MNNSIIKEIYQQLSSFSPQQQKIARVILENPKQVAQMSLAEFASFLGTSEDAVTEFCEHLGLDNFVQLREELGNTALEEPAPYSKILNTLPTFEKNNLINTLAQAPIVQIIGAYPDIQAQIQELFTKNGLFTIFDKKWEISLAQTLHLPANVAVVVIEPAQVSHPLIKQVQLAKHAQADVIVFGEKPSSRVGIESDYFIACPKDKIYKTAVALIDDVKEHSLQLQSFIRKYQNILSSKLI